MESGPQLRASDTQTGLYTDDYRAFQTGYSVRHGMEVPHNKRGVTSSRLLHSTASVPIPVQVGVIGTRRGKVRLGRDRVKRASQRAKEQVQHQRAPRYASGSIKGSAITRSASSHMFAIVVSKRVTNALNCKDEKHAPDTTGAH